ncbi:enoyl-CoA hydratase [Neorhizobium huautlense]|uniref:3-hydroxyisobutyryl-CoA hydrolase n=1 Tax=Neorhizobium huautlense TaxID=67774 RepID=A0ABT9PP43_9HYPH|nr:enoyl-CoA hydratase/isomerase family protein [Neorhizobium huautlense]MDP9836243.1 enoyl-CoA hydratase [Neorhizobium huautlense]
MSTTDTSEILVETSGALGRIILNRPKALNALTLSMVRMIDAALDDFEKDPAIAAVLVEGAGERGLCAGGDIRMLYESGKSGSEDAATFWREEYRLNGRIARFPKPYVAILDGITMGGGVGISAHGSHRIATDRLRLAMPETGIGFFPDVGATFLLSRSPGEVGTYLGLTGSIIGPADAIHAGFADVMVPFAGIDILREKLSALPAGADAHAVSAVIHALAQTPSAGMLAAHQPLIDRTFAFDTVEDIMVALAREKSAFAAETHATLLTRSPSSLKITLRMLRRARESESLEDCLNREFSGSMAVLGLADFYEGIRAAVIDKDRKPRWSPAALSDVKDADLAPFFAPHPAPPFALEERKSRHV